MRRGTEMYYTIGALVGTVAYNETAIGIPIDTRGFQEVLATLVAGAVGGGAYGTAGNTGVLTVKLQECAVITGSTTQWADITNAEVLGSAKFDALTLTAGTTYSAYDTIGFRMDANRKRYIRAHASLAGTDSINPAYAVTIMLGRPIDTLYINTSNTSTAITGTGNTEVTV